VGRVARPWREKPYDSGSSGLRGLPELRMKGEPKKVDAFSGGSRERRVREVRKPKRADDPDRD